MRRHSVACVGLVLLGCSSTEANRASPDASVAAPPTASASDPIAIVRASPALGGLLDRGDRPTLGATMSARDPRRLGRPHVDVTFAPRSTAATHLEVTRDFTLDVTAASLGAVDVPATVSATALIFRGAAPSTDVVHVASLTTGEERFEELRVLLDAHAPTSVAYRVKTGAAVASLKQSGQVIEALDAASRAWLRMPPAFAIDATGKRVAGRATLSGAGHDYVVDVAFDDAGLAYPIVLDPGWVATGAMAFGRTGAATVTLSTGKIVVIAGITTLNPGLNEPVSTSTPLDTTEIYDPSSGTFTLGPQLQETRAGVAAAVTPGDQVFVAGNSTNYTAPDSAIDILDFSSSASGVLIKTAPPMAHLRAFPMIASLGAASVTGATVKKILVAGGTANNGTDSPWSDGEVYDLSTNPATKKAVTNTMNVGLDGPAIALTQGFAAGDAQVLLAGAGSTNASLYDYALNEFAPAGKETSQHCAGMTVMLPSGDVLVAGGTNGGNSLINCSATMTTVAEIYSWKAKTWTVVSGPLPAGTVFAGAVTVPAAGTTAAITLLAGGATTASGYSGYTQVLSFDETSGAFTPYGTLSTARFWPAMAPLADGTAIVIGGAVSGATGANALPTVERSTATVSPAATACVGNGECASGFCVDGVCCDSACSGTCQACDEPASVGTCVTVAGHPRGARVATCNGGSAGDPLCGYQCSGTNPSACSLAPSTVVCAAPKCSVGGQFASSVTCSGGSACGAPTLTDCAPYGCTLSGCNTSCLADTDCVGGAKCDTTVSPGVCRAPAATLPNGTSATSPAECASGFLADRVCCSTACTGACTSCAIAGSVGTCVAVPDGDRDPHGSCPGGACSACKAGACAIAASGTSCGVSGCTNATLTTGGVCDGTSPLCPAATATPCPGQLGCSGDGLHCNTLCASNADCASGVTCNTATGQCGLPVDAGVDAGVDMGVDLGVDTGAPDLGVDTGYDAGSEVVDAPAPVTDLGVAETIVPPPFSTPQVATTATRCVRDGDCATGHCVEGVCCDSPCTDPCHSCALLPTLGKCTLEPLGTDLRNNCGPSLSCLGTCDGTGQCIGAGAGTTCARNRCTTISQGVGPAYCAAAGSACDTANVGTFDCSPYACVSAFGACATTCVTSEDCDNGFVCDTGSGKCVTGNAGGNTSSGGCAVEGAGRTQGTSGVVAMTLAMLVVATRRRRTGRR